MIRFHCSSVLSQEPVLFDDGQNCSRIRRVRVVCRQQSCRGYRSYQHNNSTELSSNARGRELSSLASRNARNTKNPSTSDSDSDEEVFFDGDFNEYDNESVDEGVEGDDLSSYQPWKILLEAPARAAWRATDPHIDPPPYLRNAMHNMIDEGNRTSKQLKRAHRKVLSIQSDLADLRERERRIMVNGKRNFKQPQQQEQQEKRQQSFEDENNCDSDDDGISKNRERKGAHNKYYASSSSSTHPVYYGYDETLATLKHRLEPNFAITKRVLSECQSLLGGEMIAIRDSDNDNEGSRSDAVHGQEYSHHWKPKRILDFGIGCGSASAAAIDLFGSDDTATTNSKAPSSAIEWVHGIDPSRTMRECSKKLIEDMTKGHNNHHHAPAEDSVDYTPPPTPRITFSNSLTPSPDESSSSSSPQGGGSFDLALFVYTASDLPDVGSCLAAAAMAFEKLKPNGVFVMIEPGTPDGFNSTRAVRNMLLDCCPPHDPEFEWEDRCHIIAPCTHNGSCPMERHKKNFFSRSKPIGKLGHDLPQELGNEEGDGGDSDDEHTNDADHSQNNSNRAFDDYDRDHVELLASGHKMSETDAFNSSFCSFVHSLPGDSRKKGEKFSYLVAQKQRFRRPNVCGGDPFRHDNVTELLTDALDAASLRADGLAHRTFESAQDLRSRYIESENDDLGLELLQGEEKRGSMGRIVRAPIKKKGHVYIDYCASPGRIIRSRVTKAMSNGVAPGIYAAARKSRWGGLWPDTMDRMMFPPSEHNHGDEDDDEYNSKKNK